MALTTQQQRFVQEYLVDHNATKAAIRAGYSEKTARKQGSRLLTKEDVKQAVAEGIEKQNKRIEVTQDEVINELKIIGFSDIRHYRASLDGVELTEGAPDEAMRAISSVKVKHHVNKDGELASVDVEYKLWSKDRALENLGKHLAMFTDKHQIGGDPDNPAPAVVLYLPKNGKGVDEQ